MHKRAILVSILVLLAFQSGSAQVGLGGFNAVLTVPTAHFVEDGHITLGFGYVPKPYALYESPDRDNLAYFATFGFLPFVEMSFRSTLSFDSESPSIGDRMASLRVRLLPETAKRPALAVGFHDLAAYLDREEGANNWFTALYLTATKTVDLSKHIRANGTLGYGVDWIKAGSHEFDGLFGGVSLGFYEIFFIKGEYDAVHFNFGSGIELLNFFSANFMVIDGKKFAFGANIRKRL